MAPMCAGPAYGTVAIAISASVSRRCSAQGGGLPFSGSGTNATNCRTIAASSVREGQCSDSEPALVMR